MFLVQPLFSLLGILYLPINYPVFSQVAGLLTICFGVNYPPLELVGLQLGVV